MPKLSKAMHIEGEFAFIELTNGKFAKIDASDADLVSQFSWHARSDFNKFYAHATFKGRKRKKILMHRLVLNAPPELLVDHIDGDGLNNTKANLRFATNSQNQHNAGISKANTSGFKGVSFSKSSKKWIARIRYLGVLKWLGTFENIQDAAAAYAKANAELHGEFGRVE